MELPGVGEQADPSCIAAFHDILEIRVRRILVPLVGVHIDGLAVAESVHEEHDIHLLEFFLLVDCLLRVLNAGSALARILFFQRVKFLYDDLCHGITAVENVLIFVNVGVCFLVLRHERLDLQTDQFVQAHIQNGICLLFRKV